MKCAVKQLLTLTPADEAHIEAQMKKCNKLYNLLVEKANALREDYIKTQNPKIVKMLYTKYGLRDLVPSIKAEHPFLKSVHSSPLKNAALQLTESIQAYQESRKGKRKGKPVGWPGFRSHKVKPMSLLYDEPTKGFKLDGKSLTLSLGKSAEGKYLYVTGEIEQSVDEVADAKILNLRIKKEYDRFYVIFSVERSYRQTPESTPEPKRIIALDPGHKILAYGVDNAGLATQIDNFPGARYFEQQLDNIKSKRDRCKRKSQPVEVDGKVIYYKPSRRYVHLDNCYKKLLQKKRDSTKQMLQTLANYLSKHYDVIAIGDYTPHGGGINRGMRRSMNNLSLIGRFKKAVEWTASRSGRKYEEWDEHGSTKTCSHCGHKLSEGLTPDIRWWTCPSCHTQHHRDENAAINGLKQTLLKELPCSGQIPQLTLRHRIKFTGRGLKILEIAACQSAKAKVLTKSEARRRHSQRKGLNSVPYGAIT